MDLLFRKCPSRARYSNCLVCNSGLFLFYMSIFVRLPLCRLFWTVLILRPAMFFHAMCMSSWTSSFSSSITFRLNKNLRGHSSVIHCVSFVILQVRQVSSQHAEFFFFPEAFYRYFFGGLHTDSVEP